MDHISIKAGQDWNFEIPSAFDKADIVIIFVSENSVTKRGFVQRELKLAIEKRKEKLASDIYIIPVLLNPQMNIPNEIRDIHCLFHHNQEMTIRSIIDSINAQIGDDFTPHRGDTHDETLNWKVTNFREERPGLPGYECEVEFFNFTSSKYKNVSQISDVINAGLCSSIMNLRYLSFHPDLESYNYGMSDFRRTNTFHSNLNSASVIGKIASVIYIVSHYNAGAAHPFSSFESRNFVLDPLFEIKHLQTIFSEEIRSFDLIQSLSRKLLLSEKHGDEEYSYFLDEDWVHSGTSSWQDFSNFSFSDASLRLIFSPYQVASYADGPQIIEIPYEQIRKELKSEFCSALELSFY